MKHKISFVNTRLLVFILQDSISYRLGGVGLGRYYFGVDSRTGVVSVANPLISGTELEYSVS